MLGIYESTYLVLGNFHWIITKPHIMQCSPLTTQQTLHMKSHGLKIKAARDFDTNHIRTRTARIAGVIYRYRIADQMRVNIAPVDSVHVFGDTRVVVLLTTPAHRLVTRVAQLAAFLPTTRNRGAGTITASYNILELDELEPNDNAW